MSMDKKSVVIHNKSQRPDNIVKKEQEIDFACKEILNTLPSFLRGFNIYLKSNVLSQTRFAYLNDIKFFLNYVISELLPEKSEINALTRDDFNKLTANDVNEFFEYCRRYQVEDDKKITVYENENRSIARKKASISVLFKYLYRQGEVDKNIVDSFNPIRMVKSNEREIKALTDDEVMKMLDAVSTGTGLTKKELDYWVKTKKRDKAILILFITYGLRVSELQQLNLSSFNFGREEFKIFRKRGKESIMPLNRSTLEVLSDYINNERNDKNADEENKDALFLSMQSKRMTVRQIRQMVKKYTSIALGTSLKQGYSPHKLRATAATSLIGRGNSIYDVAALLDHEQVTTTQLYARHKEGVKRNLVNDMEWELERRE